MKTVSGCKVSMDCYSYQQEMLTDCFVFGNAVNKPNDDSITKLADYLANNYLTLDLAFTPDI